MKYGIKIKTPHGNYVWYNWFNEAAGDQAKPYQFAASELAEEHAEQHELPNYIIEPVVE